MIDGRKKGNDYENRICRAFSCWLFPDKFNERTLVEHLPFRRRSTAIVPVVGHWHGAGDILHTPALDGRWPFCVECKAKEGWSLDGMWNPQWPIWLWWEQAVRQARDVGLQPLLVCGRKRMADLVFLRTEDAAWLGLANYAVLSREPRADVAVIPLSVLVDTAPSQLRTLCTDKRSPKRSTRGSRAITA